MKECSLLITVVSIVALIVTILTIGLLDWIMGI